MQRSDAGSMPTYRQTIDDVAAACGTDLRSGLRRDEARARLESYGANELVAEKPRPAWQRFLSQFNDALVMLLLLAMAISAGLWVYEHDELLPYEALAIFAVVVLNATISFVQESRAEAAVAALRAMAADDAIVIRDGEPQRVMSAEIVPGDLIVIEEGDTVAADGRVVESTALQTAEAALTGESVPVFKDPAPIDAEAAIGDRRNMVFSGTVVTYGRGMALVTETGMRTEMGRISGLLETTRAQPTPLQRELNRTGKLLGIIVVVIAAAMIGTLMIVEDVHGFAAIAQVMIVGVALAVAAVPEGLPAVVTVALSTGVQRMAARNAIVRHLPAVETLGSATVIASDKTGTLTKNEMTVRAVVTASGRTSVSGSGYAPEGELRAPDGGEIDARLRAELQHAMVAADRANNATVRQASGRWIVQGDPTEAALRVVARKAGVQVDVLDQRLPRVAEIPFSSERKLMSTVHRDTDRDNSLIMFTKGAVEVLLPRCSHELVGDDRRALTDERRAAIRRINESLAGEALRTLGVAATRLARDPRSGVAGRLDDSVERDLTFAGLIGMIDPPRAEAKAAVAKAKTAGIRPVMITGDHPKTAAIIAQELGIATSDRTISGVELEQLSDEDLRRVVRDAAVYARVNPADKLRIVTALQRDGEVVAMTGDGVNDAPALKTADIGVAMGITGTDVSKKAADLVLADDNFASIVAAVEEGRAIFANIQKVLRYLLSSNIGEVLTMFFGVVLAELLGLVSAEDGLVLPLLATQILWINLVTDGPPALALTMEPRDRDAMTQPPRPRGARVITARTWGGIGLVGLVMASGTLFMLDASLPGGFVEGAGDLRHAQTMAFTTLMLFQWFNLFSARSETRSAFVGLFANRWLWVAAAVSIALQLLVVSVGALQKAFGTVVLSGMDWLRCFAVASSVLWLTELFKLVTGGWRRDTGV